MLSFNTARAVSARLSLTSQGEPAADKRAYPSCLSAMLVSTWLYGAIALLGRFNKVLIRPDNFKVTVESSN